MTAVEFHPDAEAEMLAAARFYEAQAENIGSDFLAVVQATCQQLTRFPHLGHPYGHKLRSPGRGQFRITD